MTLSSGYDANQVDQAVDQGRAGISTSAASEAPAGPSLSRSCLSYSEVLAQSVSVIAPSTVPAAVLGLIFAKAGNATWLSFVLGIFGLILVSLNINQFARRSASPGSLYTYIVQGLGPTAGVLGGWALLFGYTLTGMSTLCGFALVANVLLVQWTGVQFPVLGFFAFGALGSFYIAFRDIQLSARTMLLFEGLALLFVIILCAKVWSNTGFAIDTSQLTLRGATPRGALVGVVLVVFGFSGFESSTALGEEAKDPLKNIPRSVLQSVVLAGVFFIAISYVVVLGFEGSGEALAHSEAPLNTLAHKVGWGKLGTAINIGVLLSFFSCTLASINSTARILLSMARHGLIPNALGRAHVANKTPHVAIGLSALVSFGVPSLLYAAGLGAFECQGYFGTLCSFGFIVVYILISVAAPVYLSSIGKLTRKALAYSAGAIGFMLLPLLGTVGIPGSKLFPTPDAAGLLLLAIFASYVAAGLGWLMLQRARRPKMIARMKSAIESVDLQFAHARERGEAVTKAGIAWPWRNKQAHKMPVE
jgi:amino acid transporter